MPEQQNIHLIDATMFWSPSGGVRRYITAKRRWMTRHTTWRHTVATPLPDSRSSLRMPSLPLPGSGGAYRLAWGRDASARKLCDAVPDLIESADPYGLAWASLDAARARNVPAVAFCHSNLERLAALAAGERWGGAARRAARRYAAHLYGQFDLVLAPSRAMVEHLAEWRVGEAVHQPLGVDSAVFHPARRSERWRASLGLPGDARLLVYAGRFAPEKNLAVLAGAVQRLGPRYWLLAVGGGPTPPSGRHVIVLPTINEPALLATVLASADLFVHAGTQETFGLSVLEAMACATPVVCSAAEGLAENVDTTVGFGVHDTSIENFADAISCTFERGLPELGASARRRAQACDWDHVLPRLWQHYGQAFANASQRR
jgi:alpha-1,6-mannosyltransferase